MAMARRAQQKQVRKRGRKGAGDIPALMAEVTQLRMEKELWIKEKKEISARMEQYEHLFGGIKLPGSGLARRIFSRHLLLKCLQDDIQMLALAGVDCEQFDWIYVRFVPESRRQDPRLFLEDMLPVPGNRCALDRKEALFMNLVILKLDLKQQGAAMLFGIDQSDVTDYVKYGLPVLKAILPTAEKSRRWIAAPERTDDEIRELLTYFRIQWDGTHIHMENPSDKEERKALYGHKKRATRTITIASNKDGYTIYKGRSHPESTHDLTALRDGDPDLGRITKSMKDPNTPIQDRINAFLDSGYQKAQEEYPGANMHIVKKTKERPAYGYGKSLQQVGQQAQELSGTHHSAPQGLARA